MGEPPPGAPDSGAPLADTVTVIVFAWVIVTVAGPQVAPLSPLPGPEPGIPDGDEPEPGPEPGAWDGLDPEPGAPDGDEPPGPPGTPVAGDSPPRTPVDAGDSPPLGADTG